MIRHPFIVITLAGLTACSSSPVADHYYSLVLATDDVSNIGSDSNSESILAIAPIELAPFLNQYNLVIQIGASEVQSANHHYWAEPLDKAIAKVLAKDLNSQNDDISVVTEAGIWVANPLCHLRVELEEFHATTNSGVVAGGQYWLRGAGESGAYAFEFNRTMAGDGYARAVDAMRELLRDIAELINESIVSGSYCERRVPVESVSE